MNRELKFRIWDTNAKQWLILNAADLRFYLDGGRILSLEMTGLIFQQYTGLNDKNGREIYEGDILFCSAEQMCANNTPIQYKSDYYAVVEYNPPSFVLHDIAKMSPVHWNGCEVVGNIFENPELIK